VANPQLPVGGLNLLSASFTCNTFPQLNIGASNLTKAGIRLAPEGAATGRIPVMVGVVNSPQPYQMVTVTLNLLKTQIIAAVYKAQFESNTVIGNCTVRPDIPIAEFGLTPYMLSNCALMNVSELDFSGSSADYAVQISATYFINASLFSS
jgi:hypothetical protein